MQENEEALIDVTELLDFVEQVYEFYQAGHQNPLFNEQDFMKWVVIRAGQLYIRYVLEPECMKSDRPSC